MKVKREKGRMVMGRYMARKVKTLMWMRIYWVNFLFSSPLLLTNAYLQSLNAKQEKK